MRMIATAAMLTVGMISTVLAQRPDPWTQLQQQNEQFRQQMQQQEQRTRAANVATKAEVLPYSLEQMLTSGWAITSSGMGPMGTQFVLHNGGGRWVLCDARLVNGLGQIEDRPISRCVALN